MTPGELAVTHHVLQLSSLRLHYVSRGTGPLVVLLHGFPENWWSWRYQIAPLAEAGLRVVAPDLRGYGDSGHHGPFDLDTLADDVCQLIARLGEQRAHIVGHDWGGGLAWHLASRRPEFVESVSVLNCPHPLRMREALVGRPSWAQLKRSWYFFFFLLPLVPEWLLTRDGAKNTLKLIKASGFDRAHFSTDELEPFRTAIQRPGAAAGMVGWYRDVVWRSLRQPLSAPVYDQITCPTQLIWGMRDPALGFDDLVPGTERLAPRLEVVRVPDAGHFVQAERPDAVNAALLAFLQRR